jgi:hypothetical protein
MHWETDRMRNTVAKMIDDESYKQTLKKRQRDWAAKEDRIRQRADITDSSRRIKHDHANPGDVIKTILKDDRTKQVLGRSLTGFIPEFFKLPTTGIKVGADGHLRVSSRNALGQYLIDTAKLYEIMSTFRDKQMIKKYIYHHPPLHPRRTLDQSYYCTLKTTAARDRDQVVYRGTKVNHDQCHKLQIHSAKEAKRAKAHCRLVQVLQLDLQGARLFGGGGRALAVDWALEQDRQAGLRGLRQRDQEYVQRRHGGSVVDVGPR